MKNRKVLLIGGALVVVAIVGAVAVRGRGSKPL
jgi:hypothetical protein